MIFAFFNAAFISDDCSGDKVLSIASLSFFEGEISPRPSPELDGHGKSGLGLADFTPDSSGLLVDTFATSDPPSPKWLTPS